MLKYDPDKTKSDFTYVTVTNVSNRVEMSIVRTHLEEAGIITYSSVRMMLMYPNFNSSDAPQVLYIDKNQLDDAVTVLNRAGYRTDEDK